MGCISQPVERPRSEDNNSPPLSSTSFVLKGLPQRTPFVIVHKSRGRPLLPALISAAAHLSALTTQALIRPPPAHHKDVLWME